MDVRLERINPSENKYRFYHVGVEPNLFGDHSIVISWGRIGRRCQTRIHASGEKSRINDMAEKIIKRKVRKGYVPADGTASRPSSGPE